MYFVKVVGGHMESIALAILPRNLAGDSDQSSNHSVVSQDGELDSLNMSSVHMEGFIFFPPQFELCTNLKGRNRELRLLYEGLFFKKRKHHTAAVLLHGPLSSGKTQLVWGYISQIRLNSQAEYSRLTIDQRKILITPFL